MRRSNGQPWNHFAGSKDSVIKNVTDALRDGKIKVETQSVDHLLKLIESSLDQGYHRGFNVFDREVGAALEQVAPANQSLNVPTKKK